MTTMEFIKGLTKESEEVKKISTFKTPEEIYEYLKSKGVSDTYEEYINTTKDFAKKLEGVSEKDLEGVNGGSSPVCVITTTLTATTTTTTTTTL